MSLVWMFKEHRDAVARIAAAETSCAIITDRNLRLEEDNKRLTEALEKAMVYVQAGHSKSPVDLFEQYQKQILQDEPYVDGKIPDNAWLTPGDMEPARTDG